MESDRLFGLIRVIEQLYWIKAKKNFKYKPPKILSELEDKEDVPAPSEATEEDKLPIYHLDVTNLSEYLKLNNFEKAPLIDNIPSDDDWWHVCHQNDAEQDIWSKFKEEKEARESYETFKEMDARVLSYNG